MVSYVHVLMLSIQAVRGLPLGRNHWRGRGGPDPPQILLGPLQLFSWGVQSWWGPPSAGNCVVLRRLEVRLRLRVTLHYVMKIL